VYFSKKPSIYAGMIDDGLGRRLTTKGEMKGLDHDSLTYIRLDAKQNQQKVFINTIYGLSGASTF
jgi:DNA polymerase elongation subunit (family B)